MNSLTRWDPFRELEDFQNRLSNFFGRSSVSKDVSARSSNWEPAVDITEDDKEYLVNAELPDIHKEDLHVTVENGVLEITGERKMESEEKGKRYHRVERSYGSFMRSFSLPDDADAEKVQAEFKEGVLKVHLPKSEHAKPRQIEVQVH